MSMQIDLLNSWNCAPLGRADNFGRKLFDLIAKADGANLARLRLGFPKQVAAYESWMLHKELPDMSVPSGE